MTYCDCQVPVEPADPRRRATCLRCSKKIDPLCLFSKETYAPFLDHVEQGLFPKKTSPQWRAYRNLCESRGTTGIDKFGLAYFSKDLTLEAREEHADGGVYPFLNMLQARQQGRPESLDTASMQVVHMFRAFEVALREAYERKGFP